MLSGFNTNRIATASMVVLAIVVTHLTGPQSVAAKPSPDETQADDETPKTEPKEKDKKKSQKTPALAFKMKDIDGKARDLRQYHGNVVLMVNVASQCGLTPHYEGLQALYESHKDRGFVILGFPANNFGKQEPGTNKEIKTFCKKNFGVTFPMFAKVSVQGDEQCDLYKYLTNKKAGHDHGGEIKWNFTKILVDRNGRVVDRFSPPTKPDDAKMVASIKKQLETKIPKDSALAKQRKQKDKEDQKKKPKTS